MIVNGGMGKVRSKWKEFLKVQDKFTCLLSCLTSLEGHRLVQDKHVVSSHVYFLV